MLTQRQTQTSVELMDLPCTSFRLKQLNPFLKWNRHRERICSPTRLTADTVWGDQTTAASLAASARGRMLICRMCTREEESRNTAPRMTIRTVIWCKRLHQKLPGKTGLRICEQGNFMMLFISTGVYFKQGYTKSLHYFSSQFFFLIKTSLRDLNIDQWLKLHFVQV